MRGNQEAFWQEIRKRLKNNDWDVGLGKPMQAYARPTGKERSMAYNEESQKWDEEKKKSSVHLKRGPGTAVDEPKAVEVPPKIPPKALN